MFGNKDTAFRKAKVQLEEIKLHYLSTSMKSILYRKEGRKEGPNERAVSPPTRVCASLSSSLLVSLSTQAGIGLTKATPTRRLPGGVGSRTEGSVEY